MHRNPAPRLNAKYFARCVHCPRLSVRFIASYARNLPPSQNRAVGDGTSPSRNGLRSVVVVISPPWRGRPCPFSTDKDGGGLPNGARTKHSLATIKQGCCFNCASQSLTGGDLRPYGEYVNKCSKANEAQPIASVNFKKPPLKGEEILTTPY